MEREPLLPSRRTSHTNFLRSVAAAGVVVCAVVGLIGWQQQQQSRTELLVQRGEIMPKSNMLSFSRAERLHWNEAPKMDTLTSRTTLMDYFDHLEGSQVEKHLWDVKNEELATDPMHLDFDGKVGANDDPQAALSVLFHGYKLADETSSSLQNTKPIYGAHHYLRREHRERPRGLSFDDEVVRRANNADKLTIGFYMESLCPGCRAYTHGMLEVLMNDTEFNNMVQLKVVPYGNARLEGDKIQCQHGEPECVGNTILSCMQELYPITDKEPMGFLPAMSCIEKSKQMPELIAVQCSEEHGLDYNKIRECAYGAQGKALSLKAAEDTNSLNPPKKWAPWVTVNGKPVEKTNELLAVVCEEYKGPKGDLCVATEKWMKEQKEEKAEKNEAHKDLGTLDHEHQNEEVKKAHHKDSVADKTHISLSLVHKLIPSEKGFSVCIEGSLKNEPMSLVAH